MFWSRSREIWDPRRQFAIRLCLLALVACACGSARNEASAPTKTAADVRSAEHTSDAPPSDERSRALAWMRLNLIPVDCDSAEAACGSRAIANLVGDARIILLGEATHGSHEFFALKSELIKELVLRHGVTALAFEAPAAEATAVDDYIGGGAGDASSVLAGLYFWVWDTEEVRELLVWLRDHNAGVPPRERVRFYGVDIQHPSRSAAAVGAFLRGNGSSGARLLRSVESDLQLLSATWQLSNNWVATSDRLRALLIALDDDSRWKAATREEVARVRHHAWQLDRFVAMLCAHARGPIVRDEAMAANVARVLEQEGHDRVVVWAHNGHVALKKSFYGIPMGMRLRDRFGADVFSLGFSFGSGGVRARAQSDAGAAVRVFLLDKGSEDSSDSLLSEVGVPAFALDLRSVPGTGAAAQWLRQPMHKKEVGSTLSAEEDWPTEWIALASSFDVLLFVDKVTPSNPTPSGTRSGEPMIPQPENLDLEVGEADSPLPQSWSLFENAQALGYSAGLVDAQPGAGGQSAFLRRSADLPAVSVAGRLTQAIDGGPHRGVRLRMTSRVKRELANDFSAAYVFIEAQSGPWSPPALQSIRIDRRHWHRAELFLDVPDDAVRIRYGVVLTGAGEVQLDDVTLTTGRR